MANSTTDLLSMRQDLMRSLRAEFTAQKSRDKQVMLLSTETINYLQKTTASTKNTSEIKPLWKPNAFEDFAELDEKYLKITDKWQKDGLQVWKDILEELKHPKCCCDDSGGGGNINLKGPKGKLKGLEELAELAAAVAAVTSALGATNGLGATLSGLVTDMQSASNSIRAAGSNVLNGIKGLVTGTSPAPGVTAPGTPGRPPAVIPPGRPPAPAGKPGGLIHTLTTRLHNAETATKDILNFGASYMTGQGTDRSVHNVTHPNAQVQPSAKGRSPLENAAIAGAIVAAPAIAAAVGGTAALGAAGLALGAAAPTPATSANAKPATAKLKTTTSATAKPVDPRGFQVAPFTNYNVEGGTLDGKALGPNPNQPSNTSQGLTFANTVPLTQQYGNDGVYRGRQLYQNQMPVSSPYGGMITQASYQVPQANPADYAIPMNQPSYQLPTDTSGDNTPLVPTDGSGSSQWLNSLITLMGKLTGGSIFGGSGGGGNFLGNLLGGSGSGFLGGLFGGGSSGISTGTNIGANAASTLQAIGTAAGGNTGTLNTLTQFAGMESSFDPNAGNTTSSAQGAFQITGPTAQSWIKKYGASLGITQQNYNPNDPKQQSKLVAAWIKDQSAKDVKAGIAPTSSNLYDQYFTGSNALVTANPNAIAADVDPSAAASNPNVFYSGGQARTVGEVNQYFANRLASQPDFATASVASNKAYPRSSAGQGSNNYVPSDTVAAGNATKAMPGVVQTSYPVGGGITKATPNLDDLYMFHPDPGMRNANTYIPA